MLCQTGNMHHGDPEQRCCACLCYWKPQTAVKNPDEREAGDRSFIKSWLLWLMCK
ncbi:hypothetical protein NMG60_11029546 [Bertholletia excelsa]